MGVVHAQLGGTAVHLLYKHGLAAADEFGHGHRCIVGTAHAHRAQHFIQRELFPRLQPDLAATHAVAVLAHRHKIFFMHLARLQGLKSQKQRHYLCNRCLRQLDIRVFGIQHRAAALFHQHGGLAGQIKFRLAKAAFLGVDTERACSGQHRRHRQRSGALYPCAFHAVFLLFPGDLLPKPALHKNIRFSPCLSERMFSAAWAAQGAPPLNTMQYPHVFCPAYKIRFQAFDGEKQHIFLHFASNAL